MSGTPQPLLERTRRRFAALLATALAALAATPVDALTPPEVDAQVERWLDAMSVEEKAGQMTQVTLGILLSEDSKDTFSVDPEKLREAIHTYHVGSILNTGSRALTVSQWHELIRMIQDEALKARVPVPVLYGIDAIHGVTYTKGSTLFPHNIGLAAARDVEPVRAIADATARETRASGIRWNFDPVLDVGRNPLWSRFEETFGEDAWLAGWLGTEAIRAYEKDDLSRPDAVASCMKHFVGYSDPANGKDRTPAYIPMVELWQHHLPPFERAVAAGSSTIMINSASINGMPVHGSRELLTGVLRERFGFKGLVVTDWEDVKRLHTRHRIAESPREAVRMGVEAGIDMSMVPHDYSFATHLVALVRDGEIPEARLDESVARILRLKLRLGLGENPYAEPEAMEGFGRPEYRELALESARSTMTLLANEGGVLPLAEDARVLLAGPAAHNLGALHGSWSYTWQGRDERAYPDSTLSLAEALEARVGERATTFGVPAFDAPENTDTEALARAAEGADVIVLALGEHAYAESPGAIDNLALDGPQRALARAALATGKPVIAVLLEGRPRVLGHWVDDAAAVLMAYRPGSRGAEAIVDTLYGDHNPSGILPFTYPRQTGDIMTYDRRVLANVQQRTPGQVTYGGYKPQWPFGHGLSYTGFDIGALELDAEVLEGDGVLHADVTVTNTGDRAGDKLVELYVSDLYASLSPADRRLRDVQRVSLAPGESKRVRFAVDREDLTFVNADLQRVVEPGAFRLTVGDSTAEFTYAR